MVEVIATDEFADWYMELNKTNTQAVDHRISMLEMRGVTLGAPYSSAIKGTQLPLRELRVQSSGQPIRIFYAFDPKRREILLLGGNKTGDDRFYEKYIPKAEHLFKIYLDDIASEGG